MEGEELHVSVHQDFSSKLCALTCGCTYKVRLSLSLEAYDGNNMDIKISNITEIKPIKNTRADQLSKVLHKYLTMVQGSVVSIQAVQASLPPKNWDFGLINNLNLFFWF